MQQKILFISHDATRTGAPMVLLHLLKWFRRNSRIAYQILLKDGGPLEDEFCSLGHVHLLNWDNTCLDQTKKENYLKDLAKQDFDLIYSNTIANGQILKFLTSADCPIMSHIHELEYRIRYQTKPDIIAGVTAFTDHYIAASQAVKRNLVGNHGIPEAIIDVIHEFIPTKISTPNPEARREIRKRLEIPPDALIVGACGTSDWRKGPDLFIQLAAMVRRRLGDSVHFCWLGAQLEESGFSALAYDVSKANLRSHVHFIGPQQNPQEYFALFDVFACVSREDPFPLVNLEAAAFGTPIVCFDNSGGAREFVGDDCGFVVDYLNLEDMGARLMDLLKTPDLRTRLGHQAQRKVRQNHDISVAAPQILQSINTVHSKWTPTAKEARMQKMLAAGNSDSRAAGHFDRGYDTPGAMDEIRTSFQRLLTKSEEVEFFQNIYNLASWLELKKGKCKALELFALVSRHAAAACPELAGKAFYKLGCSATSTLEAFRNFKCCLETYPAHRAARERLHALLEIGEEARSGNFASIIPSSEQAEEYAHDIQG